jgi:hypothetical protein
MSERNSIVEIVRNHLDMRNVSPNILENAPSLVRRAVVKLQAKQVLPPKVIEFLSVNKKEEKRDSNGELMYYFYYLPDDFKTLHEFYVKDTNSNNNSNIVPYSYTSYDNYMANLQSISTENGQTTRKLFTITDINSEGENNRKALIAVPFPADNIHIQIKYYPDGVDTPLDYFSPRHWEVIIEQVEIILGLRSPQDEEQTLDEVSSWKNQKGNNTINATATKKAVNFFSGSNKKSNRIRRR